MRQPSSGLRSHDELLTTLPVVLAADDSRKQAVRSSGAFDVFETTRVRFGGEEGRSGSVAFAAGKV